MNFKQALIYNKVHLFVLNKITKPFFMLRKLILGTIVASLVGTVGMAQTPKKTLPSGIKMQILKRNPTARRMKVKEFLSFHFIMTAPDGQVIGNTFESNKPIENIPVQPPKYKGDINEAFLLVAEGDSLLIESPVDTVAKYSKAKMPPFAKPGSYITYRMKILKIRNQTEVLASEKQKTAARLAKEKVIIDKYIKSHQLKNVQVTGSGLHYVIHQPGAGNKPKTGETVKVNYTGKLDNDKVFDTNIEEMAKVHGMYNPNRPYRPIEFPLGKKRVISGWDEGLALLRPGAKATLIVPSFLAYGPRGAGNDIPPNAVLVFDVELVGVKQPFDPAKQKLKDQTTISQYLANKRITNAKSTPSGLHYKITKQGTGPQAVAGKTVVVHYTGKLLNGKVFDTSFESVARQSGKYRPGRQYKPYQFSLGKGQAIKGWDEGIALLKVGTKATLYIPSHLAYGPRGAGNDIPPNSVLVFDVELLEVK